MAQQADSPAAPSSTPAPTGVRYGVLGFVCSLSMITYLDRVCFGAAVPMIVAALALESEADLFWAITGFTIAYAAFEIPSGWLGDVFGPRRTLIRIVLWWSVFTAVTGLIGLKVGGITLGGLGIFVLMRFLFGMGEAGAYPNITRALHNWFPFRERGLAQGAVWMAGRFMGGITPLVWMLLIFGLELSWRHAFVIFGITGLVWCALFFLWFRDRPEEKPSVNQAELELIRQGKAGTEMGHAHVPWLKLLTDLNLWTLCLMYFCAAYGWYFNITYLPAFLERMGVDPKSVGGALYKGGPLWMGAITCLLGGFLTDWFIRRTGNRRWGRRIFGIIGHGLCALCYLVCALGAIYAPGNVFLFVLFISLAAFWNDLTMGAAWAVCQDIGKRYSAIVAGWMNTIGNLGGATANVVTGLILKQTLATYAAAQGTVPSALSQEEKTIGLMPGYEINLLLFFGVYVLATLLWFRIDATRPVAQE